METHGFEKGQVWYAYNGDIVRIDRYMPCNKMVRTRKLRKRNPLEWWGFFSYYRTDELDKEIKI